MNRIAPSYALALAFATIILPVAAADDFPNPRDTEPSAIASAPARPKRPPASAHRRGSASASSPPSPTSGTRSPWPGTAAGGSGSPRTTPTPSCPGSFDLRLRDRVLIFEDTDGDGRADRRTVFTDNVQRLGSVELGLGGVWLLCPPRLLFVPDRDGNDVPDGPAEVVLDGFGGRRREPPHVRQRPAMGARWLALRPLRGLLARRGRRPRDARRRSACPCAAGSGAITRPASGSRCWPTGRPIPGATTGTRWARRSSSTRSTATSGT